MRYNNTCPLLRAHAERLDVVFITNGLLTSADLSCVIKVHDKEKGKETTTTTTTRRSVKDEKKMKYTSKPLTKA